MEWQPITDRHRVTMIDILRGLAVFGIFFVNILMFSSPDLFYVRAGVLPEESALNYTVRLLIDMFFTGKFYTILSFLFGFGFFIFMQRAEEKGKRLYSLFTKRMCILLVLGFLHQILLWSGDVLHSYALLGLLLMLFYRRRAKTAFIWAVCILVVYFSLFLLAFLQPANEVAATMAANYQEAVAIAKVAADVYQGDGNYFQWITFRLHNEVMPGLLMEWITYPCMFAMMLFGFYFGKMGIFADVRQYSKLFRTMLAICGTVGLTLVAVLAMLRLRWIELGASTVAVESFLTYVSGIFMSFFYISLAVLLYQHGYGKKILYPFHYAGRMALTNYMVQSIVSAVVFAGVGLYAKVDFLVCALYGLEIILLEMAFSIWWMSRFRLGPVEWVWRRLTYGGLGPMKQDSYDR